MGNMPTMGLEGEKEFSFKSLKALRKKLLDLSGRNTLLNYKHPKASCIRLIDELPDQIFSELQKGKTLTFIPVPEPAKKELLEAGYFEVDRLTGHKEIKEYPSADQWAKHLGFQVSHDLPDKRTLELDQECHQDDNLQTLLYAPDLEARLRSLRRKAETAIEESGANILYLNIGFLEWYENRESDVQRIAPLFAVPVRLERSKRSSKEGVYRYTISLKDEGLLTNITLREKLAHDFDLILPTIDDETTPESYVELVASTILRHQPRWRVRRQATLLLLHFAKQVMYQDLNPDNWPEDDKIQDHPIVSKFFGNSRQDPHEDNFSYEEEYAIDSVEDIHTHFPLVFDADSSQHSALIDAVKGENLVIEGPPGTGKSQTIANLIAASIASGKRVLFVAEKMAALNVVKNRLDKIGLGDFCLELHSHKTNKQKILSDLGTRLHKQNEYRSPQSIEADVARFEDLRQKLHDYAELINSVWQETGLTLHEIFNKATRYRELLKIDPDKLKIKGGDGQSLTTVRQKELVDQASMLEDIFGQVSAQTETGMIEDHFWHGVSSTDLQSHQAKTLCANLEEWTSALEGISSYWKDLSRTLELDVEGNADFVAIQSVSASISKLPDLVGGEPFHLLDALTTQLTDLEEWLSGYDEIHQNHEKLSQHLKLHVINPTETLATIDQALKIFRELGVDVNTSLEDLGTFREKVESTRGQFGEIENQFAQIISSVPSQLQGCFVASRTGLKEFKILTRMISALPTELWRYRDEIYDNPDLDPLLEQMTNQFKRLVPLYRSLKDFFKLENIPTLETLKSYQAVLNSGGVFRWFSADWRKARKGVLALSIVPKTDEKKLFSQLPTLVKYTETVAAVEKINDEDGSLQDLYKGIKTPLNRVVSLRKWYKAVRSEYGIGFGDRVAIGSSLLTLDKNLASGIKDYVEKGLGQFVASSSQETKSFAKTFPFFTPLRNSDILLSDPLSQLENRLTSVLSSLELVIRSEASGVHLFLLANVYKDLEQQHSRITEWNSCFGGESSICEALPLSIQPGEYSPHHLETGLNTLEIGRVLAKSSLLLNSLSLNPGQERYLALRGCLSDLRQHETQCLETQKEFVELGRVNLGEWCQSSEGVIDALILRNQAALNNSNWLNNWLEYVVVRAKLCNNGLDNIVAQLEGNSIPAENLNEVVQLVAYHQLANEILEQHEELALFSGMEQMAYRSKFQEYDRKLMSLQREVVAYKASRRDFPVGVYSGKVSNYTEISLIRHNLSLKKPRVAVRSLIKRAGKAMLALKPCFMMSPMSVAQYLEPGYFKFNLVVMDEASQIRPEDALGVVARGDSLVVVGDPKQLPPTSFFQKVINNDDNDDVVAVEVNESILESVIPMFKNRTLRWHYRSRHESLIAFSNSKFYDSNLVLFPSPFNTNDEFGVRFNRVENGRFVKRRNVEEAKWVAQATIDNLLSNPEESIGVVAMNSEQRDEIERQLEQLVKEDPRVQKAYEHNQGLGDPLFIKNLENVQGDERDVIVISMTYGPETAGASSMYQRFGPINSDVGWRRLNVLFTRSKKRMHILSSMGSGHILTSANSSRGVLALKAFLAYCENGSLQHAEHTGKPADSDFEIAVMNALAEYGYECEPQLGVTGYFLDIAVKDPGMPGRFLMGVECDGATYHAAKSTRDRDRLRQEILEQLGWRIRRIWSTDWFKNPQAQLQPILKELEELRTPLGEVKVKIASISENVVEALVAEDALDKKDIESCEVKEEVVEEILDLKERLIKFDNEVIRRESTDVDENERLLRPEMLAALLDELPYSKAEFLEVIPSYIRQGTALQEGIFLGPVIDIIAQYG